MLNKIIKAKYISDGIKAVNYCLNKERTENKTAIILKGNEAETRAIIAHTPFKNKATFGVLSFEEQADDLTKEQKLKIINDFENALLGNMRERINILWIQHSDKNGRLELNYIIPNIDLKTKKSFTPYFDKRDRARVYHFCEIKNLTYKLTSPNDPSKKQTIGGNQKSRIFQSHKELDDFLLEQVKNGELTNRAEIIEFLTQFKSIKIENIRPHSITIAINNTRARRHANGIYDQLFTEPERIAECSRRENEKIERYNKREIKRELERHREQLESGLNYLNAYYNERYKEQPSRNKQADNAEFNRLTSPNNTDINRNKQQSDEQPSRHSGYERPSRENITDNKRELNKSERSTSPSEPSNKQIYKNDTTGNTDANGEILQKEQLDNAFLNSGNFCRIYRFYSVYTDTPKIFNINLNTRKQNARAGINSANATLFTSGQQTTRSDNFAKSEANRTISEIITTTATTSYERATNFKEFYNRAREKAQGGNDTTREPTHTRAETISGIIKTTRDTINDTINKFGYIIKNFKRELKPIPTTTYNNSRKHNASGADKDNGNATRKRATSLFRYRQFIKAVRLGESFAKRERYLKNFRRFIEQINRNIREFTERNNQNIREFVERTRSKQRALFDYLENEFRIDVVKEIIKEKQEKRQKERFLYQAYYCMDYYGNISLKIKILSEYELRAGNGSNFNNKQNLIELPPNLSKIALNDVNESKNTIYNLIRNNKLPLTQTELEKNEIFELARITKEKFCEEQEEQEEQESHTYRFKL